jgi:small subunit ribosomal protein S20
MLYSLAVAVQTPLRWGECGIEMPQRKAQTKSLHETRRRTLVNKARKTRVKTAVRQAHEAATGKADQPVAEALATAYSAIDKAAKRHVIHTNIASRIKSRWMKKVRSA